MGAGVSPDGELGGRPAYLPQGPHREEAFAIGIEEGGRTLRLRLSGWFDWACVGDVEAALERIPQARIKHVVFDLQRIEFIDSAGLRTILRANDRARAEPFDVVVVRPLGLANRVFTLTRASKALTLVDPVPGTALDS